MGDSVPALTDGHHYYSQIDAILAQLTAIREQTDMPLQYGWMEKKRSASALVTPAPYI